MSMVQQRRKRTRCNTQEESYSCEDSSNAIQPKKKVPTRSTWRRTQLNKQERERKINRSTSKETNNFRKTLEFVAKEVRRSNGFVASFDDISANDNNKISKLI